MRQTRSPFRPRDGEEIQEDDEKRKAIDSGFPDC